MLSYNPSTLPVFESQLRQEHSQAFNPLLCILCPSTVDTRILRNRWTSGCGGRERNISEVEKGNIRGPEPSSRKIISWAFNSPNVDVVWAEPRSSRSNFPTLYWVLFLVVYVSLIMVSSQCIQRSGSIYVRQYPPPYCITADPLSHTLLSFEHGVTSSMKPDAPLTRTLELSLQFMDAMKISLNFCLHVRMSIHVVRGLSCYDLRTFHVWELGVEKLRIQRIRSCSRMPWIMFQ